MTRRIIIAGAGGHARVVVAAIVQSGWELCGVLDRNCESLGEMIHDTPIVGSFDDLPAWYARGVRHAFPAFGDNARRREMTDLLRLAGFEVPAIVHPKALKEPGVAVADATLVCIGAILATEVVVGEGCIVNSGAIVEHETNLGAYVHIAPGCRLAGRVKVCEGAFVGIGSSVREKITIGAWSVVGAGSVVVGDVPASTLAYGTPSRVIRKLEGQ